MYLPRICLCTYPGYICVPTQDLPVYLPRICLCTYPGFACVPTQDLPVYLPRICLYLPRICLCTYPGFVCVPTQDLSVYLRRICLCTYVGFVCVPTQDLSVYLPRICLCTYPGWFHLEVWSVRGFWLSCGFRSNPLPIDHSSLLILEKYCIFLKSFIRMKSWIMVLILDGNSEHCASMKEKGLFGQRKIPICDWYQSNQTP